MDIENSNGNTVSGNSGDVMDLTSGDIGSNNTITIQQNSTENGTSTMVKYETSNADLIHSLKMQIKNQNKELEAKDEQIDKLMGIIGGEKRK